MTSSEISILDNSPIAWGIAAVAFVVVFGSLRLLRRLVAKRVGAIAERTTGTLDDLFFVLLHRTGSLFLGAIALRAAALFLTFSPRAEGLLEKGVILVALVQVGLWGNAAVGHLLKRHAARTEGADAASAATLGLVGVVSRGVLYAILALVGLKNVGVDISALVAGLGVGGIAVALAVQNILGDLFASLTIVLDKPFVVGDAINVDGFTGTIERIGIKTTRLRSVSGEQVVFSNNDLLQSRVRNYQRLEQRRVVLQLGLVYDVTPDQLRRVPAMIREIVESDENREVVRFDRSHLCGFGASSLDVETVYWVTNSDYAIHMDVQQRILLALFERFAREGIGFAYPTQTLYVKSDPAVSSDAAVEPKRVPSPAKRDGSGVLTVQG